MLDKAIVFLQKHLNARLKGGDSADHVVLAKVEADQVKLTLDAVTVILVGLQPDPLSRSMDPFRAATTSGASGPVYPEIRLNLSVLFAARFTSYENGLAELSKIIRYFQNNPVLTPRNAPEMDPELDRLVLELQELPVAQQNDIWSAMKVPASPSLLYQVRMVVFRQEPAAETPVIAEIDREVVAS